MKRVFFGVVGLLLVYTVLPMILTRVFGWRVLKRGVGSSNIAITFDDGPDPEYTPYLLDVLKRHGVRATFFVIGAKAARYPELIRRMQEEGHQIGIHGYVHQCNWLLLPWMVRHHVERTAEIISGITGERPRLYRPTWGLLNVFNLFTLRDYDIVLWSVMVGDWRTKVAKTLLQDRLLKRMRGGDVVVLHDSGETFGADHDAPKFMMQALDSVLRKVRHHGYQWITVGEMMEAKELSKAHMSWQKRLLVAVWMKYELLFHKLFRIRTFDESNPVLHYRVIKYSGPTRMLSDGTELQRGDKVAELHFDNALLFDFNTSARSSMKLAIQMIRGVATLLPVIARHFAYNPEFEEVKALYGVTMINRGVKQLGFTVEEIPRGAFAFFTRIYLRFLVSVLHPAGKHGLEERARQPEPKTLFYARAELLRRYPVLPVTPSTKREIASNELDELHEEMSDLNELMLPHS